MNELEKLREENKSLKETCEILSDPNTISEIKKSLEEISKGNFIDIDKL